MTATTVSHNHGVPQITFNKHHYIISICLSGPLPGTPLPPTCRHRYSAQTPAAFRFTFPAKAFECGACSSCPRHGFSLSHTTIPPKWESSEETQNESAPAGASRVLVNAKCGRARECCSPHPHHGSSSMTIRRNFSSSAGC